jgi:hypothetical protein
MRGSESVDSYSKEKENGRVYLPPVGKEQNKEIIKIYGGARDKVKREQAAKPRPNNVSRNHIDDEDLDAEITVAKNNLEMRKKKKTHAGDAEIREGATERPERLLERKQSNNGVPNKAAYKVYNINQDAIFDKNGDEHKLHVRPNPRLLGEGAAAKDSIHALIKRNKQQRAKPAHDSEDYSSSYKRTEKLPQLVQDKYGKLPPLGGEKHVYEGTSPKNKKLQELSKVYKLNPGSGDEFSDKYVASKVMKKERANVSKNYGVHGGNDYVGSVAKYGKGYDDDF